MKLSLGETNLRERYDLVIACCGYESRSRHVLDIRAPEARRKLAIGYGELEVIAFEKNKSRFCDAGYEFQAVGDREFPAYIRDVIASISSVEPISVYIDISCFTRVRLGYILEALAQRPYALDVFYSLAQFAAPSNDEPANEHLCPVSSFFAGWTGDADRAVALVCGLGYEKLKA